MVKPMATHMDVNAMVYAGNDAEMLNNIQNYAVENLKRVRSYPQDWMDANAQGLHYITDVMELKTTWHPIENIGGATSSY